MKKILLQISGLIAFIIVFTGYNLNGSAKDKIRSIDVKQDQIVNILYESMRAGELEPCGCPKRPIGGLSKLTTFYQDLKEKNPNTWYINGGGALYPAVFNDETHKKQAFFKVPYISRILNLTNLDLYYYQPFDYLINMDAYLIKN